MPSTMYTQFERSCIVQVKLCAIILIPYRCSTSYSCCWVIGIFAHAAADGYISDSLQMLLHCLSSIFRLLAGCSCNMIYYVLHEFRVDGMSDEQSPGMLVPCHIVRAPLQLPPLLRTSPTRHTNLLLAPTCGLQCCTVPLHQLIASRLMERLMRITTHAIMVVFHEVRLVWALWTLGILDGTSRWLHATDPVSIIWSLHQARHGPTARTHPATIIIDTRLQRWDLGLLKSTHLARYT